VHNSARDAAQCEVLDPRSQVDSALDRRAHPAAWAPQPLVVYSARALHRRILQPAFNAQDHQLVP